MPDARTPANVRPNRTLSAIAAVILVCGVLAGCGGSSQATGATTTTTATTSDTSSASSTPTATGTTNLATTTVPLPGAGKPLIAIGDKNFTEEFVLGELYYLALSAQGFDVALNRNIGPTEVTLQALKAGTLSIYPEYLNVLDGEIAGGRHGFRSVSSAYAAAQRYARRHKLELLLPTPFSDTDALAVTEAFAQSNGLRSLGDLRQLSATLTIGAPPQFEQSPSGLPAIEHAYGFKPASFTSLDIGAQYLKLIRSQVQAAYVTTTDGQLVFPGYRVLTDPKRALGIGNVVPVVPAKVVAAEGPVFVSTINAVDALLSTDVMRQLNAAVDVAHQDPASVARQFLRLHGLMPPPAP